MPVKAHCYQVKFSRKAENLDFPVKSLDFLNVGTCGGQSGLARSFSTPVSFWEAPVLQRLESETQHPPISLELGPGMCTRLC